CEFGKVEQVLAVQGGRSCACPPRHDGASPLPNPESPMTPAALPSAPPGHIYLTQKQVAALLQVSRQTLDNWVQRGLFPQPLLTPGGGRRGRGAEGIAFIESRRRGANAAS